MHRFASLGLKSRIDAHLRAFPRKSLHRFPSLGLKSRIDAHLWAFPGKTLHRFASLALKSRIEAVQARSAGGTILFAATKISIGRGIPLPPRPLQAEPFSLPLRKLESYAENRCRYGRSRRNHSSLRQRRLESDADLVAATTVAGGTIFFRGNGEQDVSEKSYEESPIEDMDRAGLRFFLGGAWKGA